MRGVSPRDMSYGALQVLAVWTNEMGSLPEYWGAILGFFTPRRDGTRLTHSLVVDLDHYITVFLLQGILREELPLFLETRVHQDVRYETLK